MVGRATQDLIRTFRTTPEFELPSMKLLCTILNKEVKNGFKASLCPDDFDPACDVRSDGPRRVFCTPATKTKETKVFQRAKKVLKEKE